MGGDMVDEELLVSNAPIVHGPVAGRGLLLKSLVTPRLVRFVPAPMTTVLPASGTKVTGSSNGVPVCEWVSKPVLAFQPVKV